MLTFKGFDRDGGEIALPQFTSFEISKEENVPADYMQARFPYFRKAGELCSLCLYEDERPLFKGICDEIVNSKSSSDAYTYVYCRNMFALLIDNEACPGVYRNITARIIFERYLKPLGFKEFIADGRAVPGEFTVSKGSSVYEVLSEFCRIRYNALPLPGENGEILFNPGESGERVVFSDLENYDGKALNYSKIEATLLPCRLISRVNVKTSQGGYYTTVLHNSFAEEKGIVRERYMDACRENTPLGCGYTILENSNARYEEYVLRLQGICGVSVGEAAAVSDRSFGDINELYISKIKYRVSSGGIYSDITLKRKC